MQMVAEIRKECKKEFDIVYKWIGVREVTIKMMRDTADEIDKHYKNVNISRIAGAGTAIVGGAMALGGGIATLVTAGVATPITAPVIAAGTVMSFAGGTTSAGASIVDMIISKVKLSDVQKQIDTDNKKLEELIQQKKVVEEITELLQKRINSSRENKDVLGAFTATTTVGRVGSGAVAICATGKGAAKLVLESGAQVGKVGGGIAKGGAAAARFGRAALQGAAVGSIALEAVVIPLNIAEIVVSGISLYKGSETKASRQLREKANDFEKLINVVMKLTIEQDTSD